MVNIKLLKAGGFIPALEMAALCRAAQLPVLIGSMIEAGPGSLFGAHLAVALSCFFHRTLRSTPARHDLLIEPVHIETGAIVLSDRPGLGGDVDEERLDRYRVG